MNSLKARPISKLPYSHAAFAISTHHQAYLTNGGWGYIISAAHWAKRKGPDILC